MSFLANTFNAADDLVKGADPLSWNLFGKDLSDFRKGPPKKAPPESPDANALQDAAAQDQARRLSRGRTSTVLTGERGLSDLGTTSKMLLGQ